mgnify:CR=1 FL=1
MEQTEMTRRWKKPRKDQLLIGILLGVLLLVIAVPQEKAGHGRSEAVQQETEQAAEADQVQRLESRLKNILQQVEGVGEVQVMITVKNSGKKTVEKDRSLSKESRTDGEQENITDREDITTVFERDSQGREIPFVTEETAPQVEGVVIAAQGGDNLTVAENLTEAAEVLFGLEVHKIKVMKLNEGGKG